MPLFSHRTPGFAALIAGAVLLTGAPALANPNRTGLPMYPGASSAWAPDSDAQFTCHEYHASTQDAAATVVKWYRSRYPSAHVKVTRVGIYDKTSVIAINAGKEIVVSPPNGTSSTQTQIVLYAGTQCPIL